MTFSPDKMGCIHRDNETPMARMICFELGSLTAICGPIFGIQFWEYIDSGV
jgi:hypothetical protein